MEVLETDEIINKNKWQKRKYFFRQLLICSGGWTCYFIMGMTFGATTVFIPQIRKEANSTKAVTESTASWIPAILVYAGLPWTFILPILMKTIGRKYTFILVCVSNLISFIVFYFSTNITHIIISEVINGINTGSHFTVSVMIITEYTSPKYRGCFLTLKSATLFWGIFMSNAIGTFFHWKYIGIVGMVCSVYSILIAFILPESPFWLAKKKRFEKCSSSHRWLLGKDKQSEMELEKIINYQKNLNIVPKSGSVLKSFVMNVISSKQFYKPILLCLLVEALYVFSGKVVFSVYALDIISKITAGHKMSAYTAMLILDGVTVLCMYIGSVIANFFPRKKLLIAFSLVGIAFLLVISLYSCLIKLTVIDENNYVGIFLLIGYSMGVCLGPVILTQTISGELVSVESRALSSCCIDLCLKVLLGTLIKISPYIFKSWEAHGAFLFYGIFTSIILFLIYKFLPETKDKTLQEIAEWMKGTENIPVSKEQESFLTDVSHK